MRGQAGPVKYLVAFSLFLVFLAFAVCPGEVAEFSETHMSKNKLRIFLCWENLPSAVGKRRKGGAP